MAAMKAHSERRGHCRQQDGVVCGAENVLAAGTGGGIDQTFAALADQRDGADLKGEPLNKVVIARRRKSEIKALAG